jgi:hypothetical protein
MLDVCVCVCVCVCGVCVCVVCVGEWCVCVCMHIYIYIYIFVGIFFLNFQPSKTFQLYADVHFVPHRENSLIFKGNLIISTKESFCCVFREIYKKKYIYIRHRKCEELGTMKSLL